MQARLFSSRLLLRPNLFECAKELVRLRKGCRDRFGEQVRLIGREDTGRLGVVADEPVLTNQGLGP